MSGVYLCEEGHYVGSISLGGCWCVTDVTLLSTGYEVGVVMVTMGVSAGWCIIIARRKICMEVRSSGLGQCIFQV